MRVLGHPKDFVPPYKQLKSEPVKNKAMLDAIENVKKQLEESDQPLGIRHKFNNIPDYYKNKYGVQALYHFEMPGDYRLMYTLGRSPNDGMKEALFIELIDHDLYNKRFGYFKKKSH